MLPFVLIEIAILPAAPETVVIHSTDKFCPNVAVYLKQKARYETHGETPKFHIIAFLLPKR